ncbi:MAG: endonuclease/exonuclease/phosphatase family protein [Bacteroidota bacterium]
MMFRVGKKPTWQTYFFCLGLALTLLTLGSQFGGHIKGVSLLVHFTFHLADLAGFGLVLALGLRQWKSMLLMLMCLSLTLPALWPLYGESTVKNPTGAYPLSIISANLLRDNPQADSALRYLEQSPADILILTEVTGEWDQRLKSLAGKYPYRFGLAREGYHGIFLLSRYPLLQAKLWWPGGYNCPAVYAEVKWAGDTFAVVGFHPPAPPRRRKTRIRDLQFRALASRLANIKHPLVVVGDFNLTSFHPTYQDFLQRLTLSDTRIGKGRQASWPAWAGSFGLCLDHALVSSHWEVVRREVGPFIGSDHLPLELEIQRK